MTIYPCEECGAPLERDGYDLMCGQDCASLGLVVSLWRAQRTRERLGLDPPQPPAGLPRPTSHGVEIPYTTLVSDGRPLWRALHGGRLARCQVRWLCQFCGGPLPELAYAAVVGDHVVADAALHLDCLSAATPPCPYLRRASGSGAVRTVAVRREDLLADDLPMPAARAAGDTEDIRLGLWRRWTLRPASR